MIGIILFGFSSMLKYKIAEADASNRKTKVDVIGGRRNPRSHTVVVDVNCKSIEASSVHLLVALILGIGGVALSNVNYTIEKNKHNLLMKNSRHTRYQINENRLIVNMKSTTT